MNLIEILKVTILGIVQGITEWLPVSSTGHMILVDEFVKLNVSASFMQMFLVVVQLGAILAVVVLYFNRLNPLSLNKTKEERKDILILWLKVAFACIPAGVIGIAFGDKIEEIFFNWQTVAFTLILYGILFIIIENTIGKRNAKIESLDKLDFKTAFIIGLFQVLALIPGTSRSGATIIGAILFGTSRKTAAEFTFFLAIPVMFGASLIKMVDFGTVYTREEIVFLSLGTFISFIVSILTIKFLLSYIKTHDFKIFGYYRIILGIIVSACFMFTH